MKPKPSSFTCPLCDRECPDSARSEHHTLPKSQGGRETTTICVDCHRQIHVLFGLKDLAREFDTIEKLRASPDMQKWAKWIGGRSHVTRPKKAKKARR